MFIFVLKKCLYCHIYLSCRVFILYKIKKLLNTIFSINGCTDLLHILVKSFIYRSRSIRTNNSFQFLCNKTAYNPNSCLIIHARCHNTKRTSLFKATQPKVWYFYVVTTIWNRRRLLAAILLQCTVGYMLKRRVPNATRILIQDAD